MLKTGAIIFIFLIAFSPAKSEEGPLSETELTQGVRPGLYSIMGNDKKKKKKKKSSGKGYGKSEYEGSGVNLKTMPAIFWSTIGVELEIPAAKNFTVSLNGIVKFSEANRSIQKPAPYYDNGYRAELILKYYFTKKAPLGFYFSAQASYGQIVYFDGQTRPYSINARVRKPDENNVIRDFGTPEPYGAGAGFGYQMIIIPKKIIANFMTGIQTNIDKEGGLFFSWYIAPSVGIIF